MELSGDSAADFPGPAVPWRRGGFQKLGWSDIGSITQSAAETNQTPPVSHRHLPAPGLRTFQEVPGLGNPVALGLATIL